MSWDKVLDPNSVSCQVYESLTFFNLDPLKGPFIVDYLDLDGDANGNKETLEVHFCNPVYQTKKKEKASLLFVRNINTPRDSDEARQVRLTSGQNGYKSVEILYDANNEISGLSLVAKDTSDESKLAKCKDNTPWTVKFNIMCDKEQTKELQRDKFNAVKDDKTCSLTFTANHKAGCGALKASGFVQYLNAQPWIVAIVYIVGGIAITFFGGKLWDYVFWALPAFISFLFSCVVLSSGLGLFSVLEENEPTTTMGVIFAIVGFTIALAVATGVGIFIHKTKEISMGVLGGVCGFFLGFLLYSLVFAQFIKSTTAFLWITLVITTIFGAWWVYNNQEDMEVHISHFIGSYLIIRGIAFFAGGYPNEAETFYKLKKGNFDLPVSFYLYFALFIVLNGAGWFVQHKLGFD